MAKRKSKKKTSASNSLDTIRALGYSAQKVEYWNSFAKPFGKRVDLFGGIDIVAVRDGNSGVLGIQATTRPQIGDHVKKLAQIGELKVWLLAGNRLQIWGWDKVPGKVFNRVKIVRLKIIGGTFAQSTTWDGRPDKNAPYGVLVDTDVLTEWKQVRIPEPENAVSQDHQTTP